jgi:hypothetical protein
MVRQARHKREKINNFNPASVLFELNGWRGFFLGANTPVRDTPDRIRLQFIPGKNKIAVS